MCCSGHGKNGTLSALQQSIRPDLITEVHIFFSCSFDQSPVITLLERRKCLVCNFLSLSIDATITPGIVHLDKVAFVLLMLQTLVGLLNRPSAHSFPMGNFDLMKYT